MITVVAAILEKGRRPRELLSALRAKTKPLGALPRSLDALKTARVELPQNVLGGDLLGLFSNRMRELLRGDEQRADGAGEARVSNTKFADQTEFARSLAAPFSPNSESTKAREGGFTAIEAAIQRGVSIPTPPDSRYINASRDPFTPPRFQAASRREWITTRDVAVRGRGSFPPGAGPATARRRGGEAARSLLAEKLQEYWELNKSRQGAEKDSRPTAGAATAPGVSITQGPDGEKDSRPTAGAATEGEPPAVPDPSRLPTAQPRTTRTPQSWPEITARQLARKLRSSTADISSSRATQTMKSDAAGSPEKVEIQNVFNIEVKPAKGGGDAFTEDLSERLSDILLEQALQHGIDIT
ncbi:MAG: hypothetical protein ACREA2_01330 [Blastocatellia bacterium]